MERLASTFFEFLLKASGTLDPQAMEELSFKDFCRRCRVSRSSMNELLLRKLDATGEEIVISFKKNSLALGRDGSNFKKLTKN